MPIPDPTTPGDGTTCPGHHGGPTLKTPDLKPNSLSGQSGKNEIMFIKSRSGNILAFDDTDNTLRLQQKTGNAEIKLTNNEIEIKQKTGDINFISTLETRLDCVQFEVHASNDISFAAGTDIDLTCGDMSFTSGKSSSFAADKNVTFISWNTLTAKAMKEITIVGNQKTSVAAKSKDMMFKALGKITMSAKMDLGVITKNKMMHTGAMGCGYGAKSTITLQADGAIMGVGACINVN